jgi:hypothetical protein
MHSVIPRWQTGSYARAPPLQKVLDIVKQMRLGTALEKLAHPALRPYGPCVRRSSYRMSGQFLD